MGRQSGRFLRLAARLSQANSAKLLLGLSLLLMVLSVAIKSASLDNELSSWIQRSSRVDSELSYVEGAIGETGSTSQLLLQTPRKNSDKSNLLSVEALMVHLEALALASHVTVELFEVSWSLRDLCFTPTPPDFDLQVSSVLERVMPCVIKTPLDCFWEGAKLLGPEQPVSFSPAGMFNARWTTLNPLQMVEQLQRMNPRSAFSFNTLLDWMRRVGITSGYQEKPCLDPTDPNCPLSAPNKFSAQQPDVARELTGGCSGFAANQMHWHEAELVGGLERNKSGQLISAVALQSSIQLMGQQDMYDFWRKTSKVQDINNWSADKAKLVLDTWQARFKLELEQFGRTSSAANQFKIHAMTSKSMLEPIDPSGLLDLTNFELSFGLMTLFISFAFPTFSKSIQSSTESSSSQDKQLKVELGQGNLFPLALLSSLFIGLTFIASLGLSSFMNLPFNMATTQILPPIALLFGFNQVITIANIYSKKFTQVPWQELTCSSLNESLPVIFAESGSYMVALIVATIIPVQAMRVFILQTLTFISLATLMALILIPSLIVTFLKHQLPNEFFCQERKASLTCHLKTSRNKPKLRISSGLSKKTKMEEESTFEEEIFSRLQDDLKNIQADKITQQNQMPDINFSARINADGLHTSFSLTNQNNSKQIQRPFREFCDTKQNQNQVAGQKCDNINLAGYPFNQLDVSLLPDILVDALPKPTSLSSTKVGVGLKDCDVDVENIDVVGGKMEKKCQQAKLLKTYINSISSNKICQISVGFLSLVLFFAMLPFGTKIDYGLRLRDIVAQGSAEYESFSIQEKYFPVYNIFAVTKANFDYPNNQKLLYEFYNSIEQVDGVVKDSESGKAKFWLFAFRDWLIELQKKFDLERGNSAISVEGWSAEVDEAAKLAYKLLAQTGKLENPIDKNLVESNRLVDEKGIINPKAFYYYLTAWVINDVFTYTTSEANFRPEPKIWNDNPDDLKIEKARPLTYTQIPLLMKLPGNRDSLKTIMQFRSISQAFEQLNLPNFPTGIPFIFWDQFFNLDLLMFLAVAVGVTTIFLFTGMVRKDFKLAAIIALPILLTILEVYCFMGFFSIPFNNILAVLLISAIGIATIQTMQFSIVSKQSPTYLKSISDLNTSN